MLNGSNKIPTEWQAIYQLLQLGKYGQVADALYRVQLASEEVGDSIAASIAAAVHQICLACNQCHSEIDWHYAARQTAAAREDQLKNHAQAMLNHIYEQSRSHRHPVTPPAEFHMTQAKVSGPNNQHSWRQRIQEVLERGSRLLTSEHEELPLRWAGSTDLSITFIIKKIEDEHVTQTPNVTEQDGVTEQDRTLVSQPEQYANDSTAEAQALKQETPTLAIDPTPTLAIDPTPTLAEMHIAEPGIPGRPTLVVYCLGTFRVYQDDQPVNDWLSSKGQSIFKYLILHRERSIAKEILMDLFWPESVPDAARNNLNVAIYGLRRTLRITRPEFSHILFQNDCYQLNPELQLWVDVEEFTRHFTTGRRLAQAGQQNQTIHAYRAAEALYQGELLAEDRDDEWLLAQRQSLQMDYLSLLNYLSQYYLAEQEYEMGAVIANKLLAVDSCHEEAHRYLMHCYSRQNYLHLALRQYHLCVEALADDLDVEPSAPTEKLYRQIQQQQIMQVNHTGSSQML